MSSKHEKAYTSTPWRDGDNSPESNNERTDAPTRQSTLPVTGSPLYLAASFSTPEQQPLSTKTGDSTGSALSEDQKNMLKAQIDAYAYLANNMPIPQDVQRQIFASDHESESPSSSDRAAATSIKGPMWNESNTQARGPTLGSDEPPVNSQGVTTAKGLFAAKSK